VSSPGYRLAVNAPVNEWKAIFQGPDGYITIGPANSGWAHIYTDRSNFIFNTKVYAMNGFSSYDANLTLHRAGSMRLTMSDAWFDTYTTIGVTAWDYYYWSDQTLKKNIRPIGNVLNKLETINSIYFEYDKTKFTDREDINEKPQIGFIAQEVQKLFPELVEQKENGKLVVDYAKMTPILLQSIKELNSHQVLMQQKIDELEKLLLEMKNTK
jgi:hypothetical protein